MGVLQIVDGVFVALLLGEVDVEDEFGIGLAGNEEEPGSVKLFYKKLRADFNAERLLILTGSPSFTTESIL